MSKENKKKAKGQSSVDEMLFYPINDYYAQNTIADSPYYQMYAQAMDQHSAPNAYPYLDTYQTACQPVTGAFSQVSAPKTDKEVDGISADTPYMQVLTGAKKPIDTPYTQVLAGAKKPIDTPYMQVLAGAKKPTDTPYLQVLTGVQSQVDTPYEQVLTSAKKTVNTPYMQAYTQAYNVSSGTDNYAEAYSIPFEIVEKVQPAPIPVCYTYDIQEQKQEKRYAIFFLIALFSLAGIFLPFVNKLIPQLDLGIDASTLASLSKLPIFILMVLYVAIMLIVLAFSSYSIISKGYSSVGFLAFLALLLALTFSVIQLDMIYNFDLEHTLTQYGLMVMIVLPILILILSPFCVKKYKI